MRTTRTIEVKIAAEEDFNPQTEVDIESLRFGSYTEVNFGRGCKPLRTRKSGKDLIVVFNGKGSGITEEEFAPKMIGKDKKGNLIYGYARLPYVCYTPPLLSARRPVVDDAGTELAVEIQNFGLSASQRTGVKVFCDGKLLTQGMVEPLKPYEQVVLTLKIENKVVSGHPSYEVVFF